MLTCKRDRKDYHQLVKHGKQLGGAAGVLSGLSTTSHQCMQKVTALHAGALAQLPLVAV